MSGGWLPLVQCWGCSARDVGQAEARCYLFGVGKSLRDFRKIFSMSQDRPLERKDTGNSFSKPLLLTIWRNSKR